MFQVRKSSRIFGISAIFFQCCFISETQILMVVSTFSDFISRNHFLAGGFICKSGVVFQLGGLHFLIYLFIYSFIFFRFFFGGEGLMRIIVWGGGGLGGHHSHPSIFLEPLPPQGTPTLEVPPI